MAERLASLPVRIDGLSVRLGEIPLPGYYGGEPRPTGVVELEGGRATGRGESVAWTPAEQEAFAAACGGLRLPERTTVGEIEEIVHGALADPYARAAVEGAAIDLALRQTGLSPFALAGRSSGPVAFCWSLARSPDPLPTVQAILRDDPEARIKIDVPAEGWPRRTWEALARTGRVVVVDFKRAGELPQIRLAHAWLPDAWIEDPPVDAASSDPAGSWRTRVSLDGSVNAAVDLEAPEIRPAAVNVKAPRVGGWLEALRCLDACRREGWHAYVGGMFEVGVGRAQARVLAALWCPRAWNDIAPLRRSPDAPFVPSPIQVRSDYAGFAAPADELPDEPSIRRRYSLSQAAGRLSRGE